MDKEPFALPMLPPEIDYRRLVRELGNARQRLGELNASLRTLENPVLLLAPLVTPEAVSSSRIEGSIATVQGVFEFEASPGKPAENEQESQDNIEVINYRKAILLAMERLKERPIGINLLKEVHDTLLDSARGARKDRGNLRRGPVYIGPLGRPIEEARYIPPPHTQLDVLLSNWEKYINSDDEADPLVQIGVAHYQFEAIQPFLDGNGRIGRLLIPLFLYQRKLLDYPLLYISRKLNEYRNVYLDSLNKVDTQRDWETWLRFFLLAVESQSSATRETILKMMILYNELKRKVGAINAVYAIPLLDVVFAWPVVSSVFVRKKIRARSPQTVLNLLNRFVDLGILQEQPGRKRNRTYLFKPLIELLAEY